jgi:hypothetical protein
MFAHLKKLVIFCVPFRFLPRIGSRLLASILFLFLTITAYSQKSPKVYYVNDASLTGDVFTTAVGSDAVGRGQTAATPKRTLTSLLSEYAGVLISGDTIKIDAGVYNGEENLSIATAGLSFVGAGNTLTIFDDNGAGAATNYFMYIHANNVTIKDMTIQEYENNGTQTPGHSGQAITIRNATGVLIENVVMMKNGQSGGNPSISVLSNSEVTIRGGGGFCNVWQTAYTGGVEAFGTGITLTILDCILSYNYKDSGYDGGGLRIEGDASTVVTLRNCRLSNNVATDGGGISQLNGDLRVIDCIIESNTAGQVSSINYGGGFRITAGTARFARCRIVGNQAKASSTLRGGGVGARYTGTTGGFSSNKTITLTYDSCVFSGNSASLGFDVYGANGSGYACNITLRDCQFLNTGSGTNYNVVSDASSPASSINITYFGTAPYTSGSNITKAASTNTPYTPAPTPPNFTGDCGTIISLPIVLLEFTGRSEEDANVLHWVTASEVNNHLFTIERSTDMKNFELIGTLAGAGNSNQVLEYTLSDDNPPASIAYYRLKQTDYDGNYSYSEVIAIYPFHSDRFSFAFGANPANEQLDLFINSEMQKDVQLVISDLYGRIFLKEDLRISEGNDHHQIDISKFANGLYILDLYDPALMTNVSQKFAIIH